MFPPNMGQGSNDFQNKNRKNIFKDLSRVKAGFKSVPLQFHFEITELASAKKWRKIQNIDFTLLRSLPTTILKFPFWKLLLLITNFQMKSYTGNQKNCSKTEVDDIFNKIFFSEWVNSIYVSKKFETRIWKMFHFYNCL